jgi:hypothetical protein
MIDEPSDIVDLTGKAESIHRAKNAEAMMSGVFGEYYVRDMPKSGLLGRLDRMKREMDRGEESLERKLHYLFWIN